MDVTKCWIRRCDHAGPCARWPVFNALRDCGSGAYMNIAIVMKGVPKKRESH